MGQTIRAGTQPNFFRALKQTARHLGHNVRKKQLLMTRKCGTTMDQMTTISIL